MKYVLKIQIDLFVGTIITLFFLSTYQFAFAQIYENPERSQRVVQKQNNIELLQPQNPNSSDLLAVSISEEQLFVGGRDGSLRFFDIPSGDGKFGQAVTAPMTPMRLPLRQISFSEMPGFILKGNSLFKSTKNGTWAVNYSYQAMGILKPEFWNLALPNSNAACIVGVNLKKSGTKEVVDTGLVICNHDLRNNPKAWLTPILPDEFKDKISSQLTSISFDGNNGWLVGANGIIWNTTNEGKVWETEDSNTENPLLSVYAVDKNNVWAVGFNSTILYRNNNKFRNTQSNRNKQNQTNKKTGSENESKNEENKENPKPLEKIQKKGQEVLEDLRNRRVPGMPTPTPSTEQKEKEKEKSQVETQDEINKTEWVALESNPLGSQMVRLWGVKFASDKKHGWIIGDSGVILFTKDSGLSWNRVPLIDSNRKPLFNSNAPNFYAMHIDNDYCWIVGSQGVILRMRY